jgi:hypothetical protein
LPWDQSEAKWTCCFFFCPSDLTAPNKSHHPPLCHPERSRISYFTALPAATYAALRKESRMKSTEATVFDRKSGGAEGPAVRPGSRAKVSVPLVLPQNRHPERSASPICRVTQRLWRAVEGPRRCLSYPCCSELFNHRAPTGRARYGFSPGAENQELASILLRHLHLCSKSCCRASVVKKLRTAWVR